MPADVRSVPTLFDLHRHTRADWQRIFARQPEAGTAWIRFAAGHGFKAAQLVLGQMHLDGHGVPRDPAAAYGWFAKAAAIGSVEARNMVGRCHELGWGVPVDHAEALGHYRRAAAAGLAWGLYNVGCLSLYGSGVRRDHAEAFRSFAAAAAKGHAKALGMLGRCHEEGWGTSVDRAAALACYRRAAEGGDCWGAFNLGLTLAEAGHTEQARAAFAQAIGNATENCLEAIADTLLRHPAPDFRDLGHRAAARIRDLDKGSAAASVRVPLDLGPVGRSLAGSPAASPLRSRRALRLPVVILVVTALRKRLGPFRIRQRP